MQAWTKPTLSLPTNRRRRFARLLDLESLWRQRRALASLDRPLLDDVGISAGAAEAEASRPIWDVPDHWRG